MIKYRKTLKDRQMTAYMRYIWCSSIHNWPGVLNSETKDLLHTRSLLHTFRFHMAFVGTYTIRFQVDYNTFAKAFYVLCGEMKRRKHETLLIMLSFSVCMKCVSKNTLHTTSHRLVEAILVWKWINKCENHHFSV